ncbi:MAG: trigger factor [Candidatus Latescibacteria bacterium]|nr:trigger factor [Candidatus Latescibacterota bacterium]
MVNVHVEKLGTCLLELHIEVPAETVDAEIEKSFRLYQKTLQLPGFRKGRAPMNLVKARFGRVIEAEAIDGVVKEAYMEAMTDEGLLPLSQAEIDHYDYRRGESLRFTARVEVRPTLHVENYSGIEVVKPVYHLTDEDVQMRLDALRERHGVDRPVDRPAQEGDHLIADIQELDQTGVPILGRKREDATMKLGDGQSDLDRQLIGVRRGETRRVHLRNERQPNRALVVAVTIKDVRERELPPLDDEFAKDLGESTLDDLRDTVRKSLEREIEQWSRQQAEARIIDYLVGQYEFDVPKSMVNSILDSIIEDAKREANGHPIDEEFLREQNRPGVIRNVKAYFILDAITVQEGIDVTDADVDSRIDRIARAYNVPFQDMKRAIVGRNQIDRMRSDIIEEKIMTFLIDRAKIREEVVRE